MIMGGGGGGEHSGKRLLIVLRGIVIIKVKYHFMLNVLLILINFDYKWPLRTFFN